MLKFVVFENQVKVWWDYQKIDAESFYTVKLNGEKKAVVKTTNYSFKDLKADTEYVIEVFLDDTLFDKQTVRTSKEKNKIDISKPPYNAIGDGKTLNTLSIQKAIDDCGENDCVFIPDGIFLSGALFLHDNVEILLCDNTVLQGSKDCKDYPKIKSRFEGIECECYSSLINSGSLKHDNTINCHNVTIRGGKIYGGGQELRENIISCEQDSIKKEYEKNCADQLTLYSAFVRSILPGRKRGRLMQIANTENFILADCECGMSPSWNLHFIYSKNIITCGCKINSGGISNGDGWNPDSSSNCVLFDTVFDTGDDCVAIKSGKNPEGNIINIPSTNIKVFDILANGGWGVAIGSEISGGISNVHFWNCDLRNSCYGVSIKAPYERGGYVKNISFQNIVTPSVLIDQAHCCYNQSENEHAEQSYVKNILFDELFVGGVDYFDKGKNLQCAIEFFGRKIDKNGISDIEIKNIKLNRRNHNPNQIFYFKNTKNISIENIKV